MKWRVRPQGGGKVFTMEAAHVQSGNGSYQFSDEQGAPILFMPLGTMVVRIDHAGAVPGMDEDEPAS